MAENASAPASASSATPDWATNLTQLVKEQHALAEKSVSEMEACKKQLETATAELHRLKAKQTTTYSFRKESCKEHHDFVDQVEAKLEDAARTIPDGPAKTAIMEGMSLCDKRKKIIKIADKYDWATAIQYKGEHDIADDDEDAKRIKRAETEVEKTRRQSRSVRPSSSFRPHYEPYSPRSPRVPPAPRTDQQSSAAPSAKVVCFACGKPGHWAKLCPDAASGNARRAR